MVTNTSTKSILHHMLAQHHEPIPVVDESDEELDYVIHYDGKYRMGAELESEDE